MRCFEALCLTLAVGLAGCGAKAISSARCKACSGTPHTANDCRRWGVAAGCERWELLSSVEGSCENACRFEDCDRAPECGATAAPDASAPRADQGDLCRRTNGLFSSCDVCPKSCKKIEVKLGIMIDGYACTCDAPCPCGLSCGTLKIMGKKFEDVCN